MTRHREGDPRVDGGGAATRSHDLPPAGGARDALTLVSDDTIELEIVTSRLALAIIILLVGLRMFLGLFWHPDEIYTIEYL